MIAAFRASLTRLLRGGDGSQPEIEAELLHHLRCLVEEHEAQGMPTSNAWDAAEARFGSLQQYSRECRRAAGGSAAPWRLATAAGVLLAVCVTVWHTIEVRQLKQNNANLLRQQRAGDVENRVAADGATPLRSSAQRSDLVGQIVDRAGRPIASANVLVILKTWPNQRYRQDDFATVTDHDGRFRFPALAPKAGRYAIQLAALGDGYALGSTYQLVEDEAHAAAPPMLLKLEHAKQLTIQVRDSNGQPVVGAKVVPCGRRTRNGETHSIYFQACAPVQLDADQSGRVRMNCFEQGDAADIAIQLPGDDWQERKIRVDDQSEIVIVSS